MALAQMSLERRRQGCRGIPGRLRAAFVGFGRAAAQLERCSCGRDKAMGHGPGRLL